MGGEQGLDGGGQSRDGGILQSPSHWGKPCGKHDQVKHGMKVETKPKIIHAYVMSYRKTKTY